MSDRRQASDVGVEDDPGPAPLIRPPELRTSVDRTATRLELFYDLAYVLVIAELATAFRDDLSWRGFWTFTGLFVAVYWSWVGSTLYANRFDTDDVVFRLAKFGSTLAAAGCAASASDAVGETGTEFAACYLLGRLLLLAMYGRAWRHVADARHTVGVYLAVTGASAVLWAVSLLTPAPGRYVLWGVAVLVEMAGPLVATVRHDSSPMHAEHLPERFGLLVILVLGEIVAGLVMGVHDARWSGEAVTVGLLAFVVAAALWWNYFDIAGAAGSEEIQGGAADEPDERLDAFLYAHLPLAFGIALVGVGVEGLIASPADGGSSASAWVVCAGTAVFFVGAAGVVWGAGPKGLSARALALLLGVLLLVALLPGAASWIPLAGLACVTVCAAVVGAWVRRRGLSRSLAPRGR